MRGAIFIGIIILNFILQATVFSYIEIFQVAPNTALLIVVSYAMLRGDVPGALMGFLAGILIDIMFGSVIGFYALLYAVMGFLCGKPFKDFVRENYLLPIVLSIVAALALELAIYFALFVLRGDSDFALILRTRIIPATVYTAMLSVPIYILVYRLDKLLEKRGL